MTVICWSGSQLAADSLYSFDGMRVSGSIPKLRRKGNRVYGFVGTTALYDAMIDWVENQKADPDKVPKVGDDHDSRLLIFEDGRCVSYKTNLPYPEPAFAPDAWGCCAEYAIGCMDAGASPERAVELAIIRDTNLGGPVQVIELQTAEQQTIGLTQKSKDFQ